MLGLNKHGFHEFHRSVQRCKKLSGIIVVYINVVISLLARSRNKPPSNKACNELKNRPQMVSISKLYLNLRKKLLFVSVLPIEKARSHHMTLGTEVTLTGFHEFCAIFRRDTN